ncbi:DNA repair protein rad5b [Sarracenia purpurea var. burkii]
METKEDIGEAESVKKIQSVLCIEISELKILQALSQCNDNPDAAINNIFDTTCAPPLDVKRTVTSTGARVSVELRLENGEELEKSGSVDGMKPMVRWKEEPDLGFESKGALEDGIVRSDCVQKLAPKMTFDEFLRATNTKVMADDEYLKSQMKPDSEDELRCGLKPTRKLKEDPDLGFENKDILKEGIVRSDCVQNLAPKGSSDKHLKSQMKQEPEAESCCESTVGIGANEHPDLEYEKKVPVKYSNDFKWKSYEEFDGYCKSRMGSNSNWQKPSSHVKKEKVEDRRLSTVVIEDGDFPDEPDWLLVGRTAITGLSTTKGRKLENNEIVHFAFPSADLMSRYNSHWGSAKAAFATSSIVRFSTKRSGEIGRLPMEWAKCLIPLVNSSKVKVLGRCIAAPLNLHLMQEIMLYVSFYIHNSVFMDDDKSSWRLDSPSNIDSTIYPLLTLFKLLKNKPFQKAEFTPEELDSRKRSLNLEGDSDEAASMLPIVKRIKGCQAEQNKDEQVISESSLNKLVGAADVYDLEEMDPPDTLTCDLRPYQKQALYWMSELEKGAKVEKAEKTLHPCWAAYRICDERASSIYVNVFSGEAATQFPTAMEMARGGILADAMGLGKTVMTIALILARPGRSSDNQKHISEAGDEAECINKKNKDSNTNSPKAKGHTLIICPMALLSQWKDELETHSMPETLSIFVHYGGDRTNDHKVMAEYDVVLTTYGVLTAAYKQDAENSIFHRIDWYRVVLDEAHTIKSSRTQGARAAFTLSSHCRWCLTGTPLQNNLEDLYSLLCFLHVEPWCNWAWWSKLIQRPYESGDQRGLKLVKAILRPLMLRRTKDSKDKEGRSQNPVIVSKLMFNAHEIRPILVLPPTDIQVIECEQSEAEHDFYNALFKRSKVQFDQFVAQGKVLHNYANILELLLRLRQCCNHPFLVMSRGDSQEFADLNKLARRFLETNPDSVMPSHKVPTRAYVEEVVEGIRRGENAECPICLESADDPVLTPCAHRMCRECLLSSWRSSSAGLCPICRQLLKKSDLITCPSENRFRIDVDKNWKESSKVTQLLNCLENIRRSGSGEKSIVFSQWTSFLDLLEIRMRRRGIGFLRFDGRLVQKQRERVLKEFNETRETFVLLMSLKVGGVGLNLTAACNVFLMDPWWNPAVEEQAIMRIHRIGQKRTVSVRRFIVKDTVEERMQQVQARKQRMIAGALTDEEVRSARIEELKMLFR